MSVTFRTLTNDSGQVILSATEPATRYNGGTGYHVASYRPSDGVEAAAYGALAGNRRPAFGPNAPASRVAHLENVAETLADRHRVESSELEALRAEVAALKSDRLVRIANGY